MQHAKRICVSVPGSSADAGRFNTDWKCRIRHKTLNDYKLKGAGGRMVWVEGMTETYATLMRGSRLPEMRTDGEEKRWRTGNPTPTGQRATIKIIKCNLTSSAFNCINSRQSVHGSVPRPVKPASNSTFVLKSYLSQSKCE